MGDLLGKVAEHIKGSVSGEYHHFISGGGDPVMWFNGQLESASGHAAQGAAEAVAPIIRGEIDYMFDQTVDSMGCRPPPELN